MQAAAQNPYGTWRHGPPGDSSFFPIAVWLQEPPDASAYKQAGVNVYVGLWEGPTQAQLTALRSAGMPVICDQNATGLQWVDSATIIGWMHGDEPDNAQWNEATQSYDPCISPDTVRADYARWRAADSTRPVYLNLGMGVAWTTWYGRGDCTGHTEMYPRYIQGCDIVSFDIYPVVSSDATVQGNLWYVPKGVDSLQMWSAGRKPVWCWIECTHINSQTKPTTSQVKTEVWMALVHGAQGFGYFCHEWVPSFNHRALLADAEMLAAVTAINSRVRALAPVLNSPTVDSSGPVSRTNTAVPVDAIVKRHGGSYYLFSVAMRGDTTSATFRLPDTTISGTAEVLDESRSLTVTAGRFTDAFAAWGVHLYRIAESQSVRNMAPAVREGANSPAATRAAYTLRGAVVRDRSTAGVTLVRRAGDVRPEVRVLCR